MVVWILLSGSSGVAGDCEFGLLFAVEVSRFGVELSVPIGLGRFDFCSQCDSRLQPLLDKAKVVAEILYHGCQKVAIRG